MADWELYFGAFFKFLTISARVVTVVEIYQFVLRETCFDASKRQENQPSTTYNSSGLRLLVIAFFLEEPFCVGEVVSMD